MSLLKDEIITLQRKNGSETIRVIISKPYFGLSGYAEAKELTGLGFFTREKMYLWKDCYGDWWVEVREEEDAS